MFSRDMLTTEDVRRCLQSAVVGGDINDYLLPDGWQGEDPVPIVMHAGFMGSGALCRAKVPVNNILDWLNRDCGYFDPVAMGM